MPRIVVPSLVATALGAALLACVAACANDSAEGSRETPAVGDPSGDAPLPPVDGADAGAGADGAATLDGATLDGATTSPPGFNLVTDVNAKGAGSSPEPLAVLGGTLLFAATDDTHGRELFRTDGTQAGTSLVADLLPGAPSANPVLWADLGSRVVVAIDKAPSVRQLYVTDGTTAGTSLLFEGYLCAPRRAAVVGSTFYFCASSATAGGGLTKLWKSDGTVNGTVIAANVAPGGTIVSFDGALYFPAQTGGSRYLYRYDGTSNGAVVSTAAKSVDAVTVVGTKLVFYASDAAGGLEPWVSDGTEAGTQRIVDINPGAASGLIGASPPVVLGGQAFFVATEPTTGTELWKTDGTAAGTSLVKDIFPSSPASQPSSLRAVGNKLYFAADDGFTGREPWVSDGTAAGTKRLADVRAGVEGAGAPGPREFTAVGSTVYFEASDVTHGHELWKTDGTEAGTAMVADTFVGAADAYPDHLLAFGSSLAYACADDTSAAELCFSDGTAAGTGVRVRVGARTGDGVLGPIVGVGTGSGPLFFAGRAAHSPSFNLTLSGLWSSDGTAAGTTLLTPPTATLQDSAAPSVVVSGVAYFRARTEKEGTELWKSDGTVAGTKLVRDLAPGAASGLDARASLVAVGSTLYFVGSDGAHGRELWRSDGTETGTTMVADLGVGDSLSDGIVAASDAVYFVGRASTARGVYRGDASGVRLLQTTDIAFGVAVGANRPLWFQGGALYTSDGTAAKVTKVYDVPSGSTAGSIAGTSTGAVFTLRQYAQSSGELWTTDGTAAGTVRLAAFAPPVSDPFCGAQSLADGVVGSVVYFCADDGAHGPELWRTDLTPTGTALVKDVQPGAVGAKPTAIASALGRVYFSADDGTHGVELWSTDGTDAGTRLVGDLVPGAASSSPSRVTVRGAMIYIGATGPTVGRELWWLDPSLAMP